MLHFVQVSYLKKAKLEFLEMIIHSLCTDLIFFSNLLGWGGIGFCIAVFLPATSSNSFCQQDCHLSYYIFFWLVRWYLLRRNLDTGRGTLEWKVIHYLLWIVLITERKIGLKSQCVRWSCNYLVNLKIRQKEFKIGKSVISKRATIPSHH